MHTWLPSSNIHRRAAGASSATWTALMSRGTRRSSLPKTTIMGWVSWCSTPARVSFAANAYVSSGVVVPLLWAKVATLCAGRSRMSAP